MNSTVRDSNPIFWILTVVQYFSDGAIMTSWFDICDTPITSVRRINSILFFFSFLWVNLIYSLIISFKHVLILNFHYQPFMGNRHATPLLQISLWFWDYFCTMSKLDMKPGWYDIIIGHGKSCAMNCYWFSSKCKKIFDFY